MSALRLWCCTRKRGTWSISLLSLIVYWILINLWWADCCLICTGSVAKTPALPASSIWACAPLLRWLLRFCERYLTSFGGWLLWRLRGCRLSPASVDRSPFRSHGRRIVDSLLGLFDDSAIGLELRIALSIRWMTFLVQSTSSKNHWPQVVS